MYNTKKKTVALPTKTQAGTITDPEPIITVNSLQARDSYPPIPRKPSLQSSRTMSLLSPLLSIKTQVAQLPNQTQCRRYSSKPKPNPIHHR
jgi:hypothetical protein